MAGTKSVPKSIHKIVIVPRGRGILNRMNIKNGEISGMLLVNVYAIDFFKLSKIKRPAKPNIHIKIRAGQSKYDTVHSELNINEFGKNSLQNSQVYSLKFRKGKGQILDLFSSNL